MTDSADTDPVGTDRVEADPVEADTSQRHGEGTGPRPVALGIAFVVLGGLWLAAQYGLRLDWGIVLPGVIVAVGVLLLLGGRHVRVGGIVAVGLIAATATLILPLAPSSVSVAIGDVEVVPSGIGDLEASYAHGIGSLVVDLSELDLPPGTTFLDVEFAIGEVTVIVPPDVGVSGSLAIGAGELDAFGTRREGVRPSLELDLPGRDPRVLALEVRGLVGEVRVRR